MWAPIPIAWFWVGSRVYNATGSILADGMVALAGFLATAVIAMALLLRVDQAWIVLRRRSGYDQREGALTQVVIAAATVGILAFLLWYYVLERAFVIPFMPTH
jgi:hypothetical protein